MKLNVNKLDIVSLKTFTTDLSKLINVADNDVVKKTMFEEFVTKLILLIHTTVNTADPDKYSYILYMVMYLILVHFF